VHTPQRPAGRPLIRRDAEGVERTAPGWESLTERLIREAQEDGRFDDLPARGRRLRLEDERYAGELASAHHLLRNAGAAPPWIEADKEVRRCRERIERLLWRARRSRPLAAQRLRDELDALADADDAATRRLETLAPTPRQQRARLDRTDLHARLERALGSCEGPR
jgi:hypothetical protein